jgi:F0F1-type ATP synthase assembly protein I
MTWLFCCPDTNEAVSNLDVQKGRRQALAVVLSQVLLGAVVAAVCFAIWGSRAGASALLGTAIGVAATTLMAFAMLRHGEGATLMTATVGFFLGWLVKVGFTVALLVVAFRSPGVSPVPLLAAYVVTFFGYWIGAARLGGPPASNDKTGRSG